MTQTPAKNIYEREHRNVGAGKKWFRTQISVDLIFNVHIDCVRWSEYTLNACIQTIHNHKILYNFLHSFAPLLHFISHSIVIYWKCDRYHVPNEITNQPEVSIPNNGLDRFANVSLSLVYSLPQTSFDILFSMDAAVKNFCTQSMGFIHAWMWMCIIFPIPIQKIFTKWLYIWLWSGKYMLGNERVHRLHLR